MSKVTKERKQKLADVLFLQDNYREYFDAENFTKQGKIIRRQAPEVKLIKDLFFKEFKQIVKPVRKRCKLKQKRQPLIKQQIARIRKQCFDTSVLSFDPQYFENILNQESKDITTGKFYRNCLSVWQENDDNFKLVYTYKTNKLDFRIRTVKYSYEHKMISQRTHKLPVDDVTGVYESIRNNNQFYFRHLYGLSVLEYKQQDRFKKQHYLMNSAPLMNIIDHDKGIILLDIEGSIHLFQKQCKYLSREQLSITAIQRTHEGLPVAYRPQSLSYNDQNTFYLQTLSGVKIFDFRTGQIEQTLQMSNDQYVDNMVQAVQSLENSNYIVLSTQSNFKIYDIRNTDKLVIQQNNCCEETGIQVLQSLKNSVPHKIYGFSPYSNGNSVLVTVDVDLFDELNDAQIQLAQLIDGSLFHSKFDQMTNGFPEMLLTSTNFDGNLKTHGLQIVPYRDKYYIFSSDDRGGLGFCLVDQDFQLQSLIEQVEGGSSIELSSEEYESIQNSYSYDVFKSDSSYSYSDADLEEPKIKKKKLIQPGKILQLLEQQVLPQKSENTQIPLIGSLPEQELGFEERILLNHIQQGQKPQARNNNLSFEYSKKFTVDQKFVQFLKNNLGP